MGSLMLEKDAFITVSDFLKPECFYKEAHQKIYRGIQNLSLNNEPVDILTVSEEMKRLGELEEIGGYYYLAQLPSKVASAAHIEFHARIVVQKYIQRELIRVCTDIQNKAYDEATDVADLVDMAQKQVFEIAEGNIKKETTAINALIDELGIPKENTYAFGDGLNDADMLEFCQYGIAVGNAKEALKEIADEVTDDIKDDGIYNSMKKYGLID